MLSGQSMSRVAVVFLVVAAACGGGGGSKGPTFQGQHPRIYLGANKDRLVAGLAHPAGQRFQKMVDGWVAGQDVYAFPRWNAALLGQLTGDPKYCAAAVASIDKDVMAAEQAIAGGSAPDVAGDDYLQIGADDRRPRAGLRLVLRRRAGRSRRARGSRYANQAVSNVWNPDSRDLGRQGDAVVGLGDRRPERQLLLLVPARDDAARPRGARRAARDANAWLTEFHDTKLMGELVPTFDMDLVGGGSREGTGYGVAMRELFELYDLWQGSTGEVIATKTAAHPRVDAVVHPPDAADARPRRADRRSVARLDGVVLRLPPRATCRS